MRRALSRARAKRSVNRLLAASLSGVTSYQLVNVPNGDGTTSTREYAVQRPEGLTPKLENLAPAVLVFYESGHCGQVLSGRFGSLAAANRFIVVYMEVPCERGDKNWDKRNIDQAESSAVNDEPYVTAVVQDIKQCPESGAGPNQCVDPQRIYAAGTSSGANMTADVMCDPENSSSFRGYLIDSSSLQLYNGAPACPSPNRSFFVMMALSNYGIDAGLYYNTAPNPHLDVPLFADWAAARLGCEGPRVDDAIGSPDASTLRYTYSGPCGYAVGGSRAVVTLGVQNGGHTWSCQDSDDEMTPSNCPGIPNPPGLTPSGLPYTNGLFIEKEFWNFVAQSISTEASEAPLEDTSPPVVSVTSPSQWLSRIGSRPDRHPGQRRHRSRRRPSRARRNRSRPGGAGRRRRHLHPLLEHNHRHKWEPRSACARHGQSRQPRGRLHRRHGRQRGRRRRVARHREQQPSKPPV